MNNYTIHQCLKYLYIIPFTSELICSRMEKKVIFKKINMQKYLIQNLQKVIISFALVIFTFLSMSFSTKAAPTFTGNAETDFTGLPGVSIYTDGLGDVGVPISVGNGEQTGWNIKNVYVWYDVLTDKLYVGIRCTQICGDADGNGDPAVPDTALRVLVGNGSGTDAASLNADTDWGSGETAGFLINTNTDVNAVFNIIVGKRPALNGIANWGLYYFNNSELNAGVNANWFNADILDPNRPIFTSTTVLGNYSHDLEFVINDFSELQGVNPSKMKIGTFMGSITDDGIGEDTLSGQGTPFSLQRLTVKKVVVNDNGGTKVISDFPLSVANYGPVTHNVPVSVQTATTYTVSETIAAGYTQTSLVCVDDDTLATVTHPLTFAPGQNITCTITNNDIAPQLKVIKQVINDNGGTKVISDFILNLSPTIGTVTHDVYNTVLAGVAYTASETQLPEYDQTSLTCKDDTTQAVLAHPVTLALAQNASCTIVNNDKIPRLRVIKVVTNNNGGTKIPADFPLTVSTIGSVVNNTYNNVTAGVVYTVSETQQTGFTQTSLQCVDDTTLAVLTHPVTLVPGQSATCTITNDDIAPKLKVVKQVINDNGGTKVISDFVLNVSPTIGTVTHNVYNNVNAGVVYTVSETAVAGYTQTSLTCVDDVTQLAVAHPVTLQIEQSVTCTIVNNDISPKLKVVKQVINDNGGTKVPADFILNISPTIGIVTHNVYTDVMAAQVYTVSETQLAGYNQTSLTCVDDSNQAVLAHPITLTLAQSATCTIVNDDISPKLKVVKQVTNDNGGTKVPADFVLNVTPTIGTVSHNVSNNVNAGIAYTVSETQINGYRMTSLSCIDDTTQLPVTHPVTLSLDQKVTCTIVNNDNPNIGDFVWRDTNFNGTQDPTEVGINGIVVNLYSSCSTTMPFRTTTTANHPTTAKPGYYLFMNLEVDCVYTVEFVKPTGSVFTTLDTGVDQTDSDANLTTGKTIGINLVNDVDQLTWDAGIYYPACIGDMVFEDVNVNGIYDTGDFPIVGAVVKLTFPNNTTITTTTDANGWYNFCGLVPAEYKVDIDTTQAAIMNYPKFALGYYSTTALSYTRTLIEEEKYLDADFGFAGYSKIGDRIFIDKDKNCIFDSDNVGIKDVKVNLKDSTGTVIKTTTTDADGYYYFIVPSGFEYTVEVDSSWNTNPVLTISSPNCSLTKPTGKLTSNQFFETADFGFKEYPFELQDSSQNICLGKDIVFYVDIVNNNPATIKDVIFTDELPSAVEYISFTSSLPYKSFSIVGNKLVVNFDSIPGNTTVKFQITAKTLSVGEYVNTSYTTDLNGKLVSEIQKVKTTILDLGHPLCGGLPKTGIDINYILYFALLSLMIGFGKYKFKNIQR